MTNGEAIHRIQEHMRVHKMGQYPHELIKVALDMSINALREQEERRWIPVTERLPEPTERAICINDDGDMMIGTYTEWGWMFPCYFKEPTYWMPVPEPPKGE